MSEKLIDEIYLIFTPIDFAGCYASLKSAKERCKLLYSSTKVTFKARQYGFIEVWSNGEKTGTTISKDALWK